MSHQHRMDDSVPPKRTPGPGIAERKRAQLTAAPFAARFSDWNARAAHLSAQLAARATTPAEREEVHRARQLLAAEVLAVKEQFRATVADEPPHGRFAELDAAFARLLELIGD